VATPERVRLFVALELPSRVRSSLDAWRREAVGSREELRLVAASSLHVTLAFLGSRAADDIDAIAAAVSASVAGSPAARLRVAGVSPVPPRRPRLFAFDLADSGGAAGAVQAAVSEALASGGFYKPEKRPFWPHVTFARVRRGARRVAPIEGEPPSLEFTARHVTLYRSHLSPRGARYEALERVELRGGPGQ
jgi:RNA 2',3'-cyclic 3'-phosphodiesterase